MRATGIFRSCAIAACAGLLAIGCQAADQETIVHAHRAIVGGSSVSLPFVVTIGSSHHCTGTLIGDRLVMTAAHCAAPPDSMPVTFWGVTPAGGGATTDIEISGFVMARHPNWGQGAWYSNDFALVRLNESATSRVANLTWPRMAGSAPPNGVNNTLVGFGLSGAICTGSTGVRLAADTPLDYIDNRSPQPTSGGTLVYNDSSIYGCYGDSGGPTLDNSCTRIQGVQSWGDEFANPKNTNFGALYRAMDWLGVVAYGNSNYGGGAQGFIEGNHDVGELVDVPNDTISSLKVGPGFVARLWAESGFWGDVQDYTGDVSYVGNFMNDRTSSLQVLRGVTMYRDANFSGVQQTFTGSGSYDVGSLTVVGNDQITSMRVAPGVVVQACAESGFWGDCQPFRGWVSNVGGLLNERISSFTVTLE
jgi:hypothetical protein